MRLWELLCMPVFLSEVVVSGLTCRLSVACVCNIDFCDLLLLK